MASKTLRLISDRCAESSPLPLTSNLLLRQLAGSDRLCLEPHIQRHIVTAGTTLFDVGQPLQHAYFPIDTIVSLEQSARIEVALAGREGMAGWTAIAGFCHSPYRATVRCRDGLLLTIDIDALLRAVGANPKLRSILWQYMVVTAVQMAEGLGAHAHHRVEAAVARWLLMRHDRVGGDWILAQHQEIADCLGARRASVTDCLHILEGERHIRCRRGRILILNRANLESRASGAYGAAESLYRASLGAFGKSPALYEPVKEEPIVHSDGRLPEYA
jgi:CRP-like cAMP-binding protein